MFTPSARLLQTSYAHRIKLGLVPPQIGGHNRIMVGAGLVPALLANPRFVVDPIKLVSLTGTLRRYIILTIKMFARKLIDAVPLQRRRENGMSPKLPHVTGAEVIRALRRARWYLDHQRGSHVYLKHPDYPGRRVTVPVHSGETIKPKTLQTILKQAGLSLAEFFELL